MYIESELIRKHCEDRIDKLKSRRHLTDIKIHHTALHELLLMLKCITETEEEELNNEHYSTTA